MAVTITLVYDIKCKNVSQATMNTKWAAIPTDADIEAVLQLTKTGDAQTTPPPDIARRTIQYLTNPVGAPIDDASMYAFLSNYYTKYFSSELACPVYAAPPT